MLLLFLSDAASSVSAAWTTWHDAGTFDPMRGNESSRFQSVYDPFTDTILYTNASSSAVRFWLASGDPGFVVGGLRSGLRDGETCLPQAEPCDTAQLDRPRGISPDFGDPRRGIAGLVGIFVADSINNCVRYISLRGWCGGGGGTSCARGRISGTASGRCHPFDGAGIAFGSPTASRFTMPHQFATSNRFQRRVVLFGACVAWLDVYERGADRVTLSARHFVGGCGAAPAAGESSAVFPGGYARDPRALTNALAAAWSPCGNVLFISDHAGVVGGIRKVTPANRVLPDPASGQLISGLLGSAFFLSVDGGASSSASTTTTTITSTQTSTTSTTTTTTSTTTTTEAPASSNSNSASAGSSSSSSSEGGAPSGSGSAASQSGSDGGGTPAPPPATPAPGPLAPVNGTLVLGLDVLQDYAAPFLLVFGTMAIGPAALEIKTPGPIPLGKISGGASGSFDWLQEPLMGSNPSGLVEQQANTSRIDGPPRSLAPASGAEVAAAWTVNINPRGILTATKWMTFLCRWPCQEAAFNVPTVPAASGNNSISTSLPGNNSSSASSTVKYSGYAWNKREKPLGTTMTPSRSQSGTQRETRSRHPTRSRSLRATDSIPLTFTGNESSRTHSRSMLTVPPPPDIRALRGAAYLNGVLLFVGAVFFPDQWPAALALSRQRFTVRCAQLAALQRHRFQWTRGGRAAAASWRQRVELARLARDNPLLSGGGAASSRLYDDDIESGQPMPFADSPTQMRFAPGGADYQWSTRLAGACIGNVIFGASFVLVLSVVAAIRHTRAVAPALAELRARIRRRKQLGITQNGVVLRLMETGLQFPVSVRDLLGRGGIVTYAVSFFLAWLMPATLSVALVVVARDWADLYGLRTFGIAFAAAVPTLLLALVAVVLLCRRHRAERWVEYVPDFIRRRAEEEGRKTVNDNNESGEGDDEGRPTEIVAGSAAASAKKKKKNANRGGNNNNNTEAPSGAPTAQAPSADARMTVAEWLLVSRGEYQLPENGDDAALRQQERDVELVLKRKRADSSSSASDDDDDDDRFRVGSPTAGRKKSADAALASLAQQLGRTDEAALFERASDRIESEVEFFAALPLMRAYSDGRLWVLAVDLVSQLALAFAEFLCIFFDDDVTLMCCVVLGAVMLPALVTLVAAPYTTRLGAVQILFSSFCVQLPCLVIAILLHDGKMAADPEAGGADVVVIGNIVGALLIFGACVVALLSLARWLAVTVRPLYVNNEEKVRRQFEQRKARRQARREAALAELGKSAEGAENVLEAERDAVNALYQTPAYEIDPEARRTLAINRAKAVASVSGGGLANIIVKRQQQKQAAEQQQQPSANSSPAGSPRRHHQAGVVVDSSDEEELRRVRASVNIDRRQRKFERREPDKHRFFAQGGCEYPPALAALSDRELEAFLPKAERVRRARQLMEEVAQTQRAREQERMDAFLREEQQKQQRDARRGHSQPRFDAAAARAPVRTPPLRSGSTPLRGRSVTFIVDSSDDDDDDGNFSVSSSSSASSTSSAESLLNPASDSDSLGSGSDGYGRRRRRRGDARLYRML